MSPRKAGLGRGLEALIPTEPRDRDPDERYPIFGLVNPDGTVRERLPITLEEMRALYADMVEARAFDEKCTAMQKQGRLATYAPFRGQEAAQIGASAVLKLEDWVVATYRDAALNWRAGYPWELLILGRTGDERGGEVPEDVRVLPPSITVGGHMLHAVGLAWSEAMDGSDAIALTSFGDGATSEGDFHEAMNLAAVYRTPTVFLCQNNGYAISHPTSEQTKSDSIAAKSEAYGMPGLRVDGNDVVAVMVIIQKAAERARRGEGPSLIEAVTYRMGPHTTADDPSRYRSPEEAAEWEPRDPLKRVRLLLSKAGGWSEGWQAELERDSARRIEEAVDWAESLPPPSVEAMFGRMFASTTPRLAEQLGEAGDA